MISVTFTCGHVVNYSDASDKVGEACPVCREPRVANVKAPAPRFRGACTGPRAKTEALPPFSGQLG